MTRKDERQLRSGKIDVKPGQKKKRVGTVWVDKLDKPADDVYQEFEALTRALELQKRKQGLKSAEKVIRAHRKKREQFEESKRRRRERLERSIATRAEREANWATPLKAKWVCLFMRPGEWYVATTDFLPMNTVYNVHSLRVGLLVLRVKGLVDWEYTGIIDNAGNNKRRYRLNADGEAFRAIIEPEIVERMLR